MGSQLRPGGGATGSNWFPGNSMSSQHDLLGSRSSQSNRGGRQAALTELAWRPGQSSSSGQGGALRSLYNQGGIGSGGGSLTLPAKPSMLTPSGGAGRRHRQSFGGGPTMGGIGPPAPMLPGVRLDPLPAAGRPTQRAH